MSRLCSAAPRRAALISVMAFAALIAGAGSAAAHPFGPPPTALVTARGDTVLIEWAAAPDDAMIVGMTIGVLSDDNLDEFLEGPVQVAPPAAAEDDLDESERLREYLLDHVKVVQDGRECEGEVGLIEDFLRDGARIVYECPDEVEQVDLSITVLHDVHEAYRTFAITEGDGAPAQSVFTTENAEQTWDFTVARDDAPAAPLDEEPVNLAWLPPLVVGVLAAAGAGVFLARRHRSGGAS